jgi:hypothetical protein
MKISRLLIALLLFALSSCGDMGTPPSVERSLDDIREAVFRYQFLHNVSGLQQRAGAYFIGLYVTGDLNLPVHYVDPSDNLLARFAGNTPPVKKASESTYSVQGVFDLRTGARGLLFRIESIKEIDPDQVEVTGGYFEAGLSASGNVYTVTRTNDRWTVVKDSLIWIA